MAEQYDVLHVDDGLWVVAADTHSPAYDFAFSRFFPCRRRVEPAPAITAIARLGALREYERVFQVLQDAGVTLANSPGEHRLASELPEWYPRVRDVTPRSVWFDRLPDPDEVAEVIGWPIFVKGARQTSRHSLALSVARGADDYVRLVAEYYADPILHWQPCVLRELVPLRPVPGNAATDIPASFEFRTFWRRGHLVGAGRYWTSAQPYDWSARERRDALGVAEEVARRLAVPFLVVDVAQLTNGSWIAIECNDAQESSYAGASPFAIWQALIRLARGVAVSARATDKRIRVKRSGGGLHHRLLAMSLAACLTVSSVEASPQDAVEYAWWLTAKVPVAGETVAGIPIRQLHPEWRSASALSLSHLPAAAHQPGESPADHHAAFTLVVDLDDDGKAERSLVGVYEKSSGERGRFLLVLARGATGWAGFVRVQG